MPEESELRKLFEEQRHWINATFRKMFLVFVAILVAVIGCVFFYFQATIQAEKAAELERKRHAAEVDWLKMKAELALQNFRDSLKRIESQKKLDDYLRQHPSERPKAVKK